MNLKRKVGPFPLWFLLIAGAILGYLFYRHAKGSMGSSGNAIQTQQVLPQTSDQSALGAATQAGSPTDTGQTTQDYLQALGSERSDLLGALMETQTNVEQLAASQIAAAQTNTSLGAFNTMTQPVAGVEPNSNTPTVFYVQPQVVTTPNTAPPTSVTVSKPAQQPSAISRFYTYKRDVPLGPGQTVHFKAGRGYYAA